MRVTSTIRDYVQREVQKKIDSKHTEIKAYEDACDEAIDFLKDFRSAFTDFIKEYFKKADKEKFDIRIPDPAFYPSLVTMYTPYFENGYLKPKNKPDFNAITNEINTEVDNILIALELGATKAELDEMLEAL